MAEREPLATDGRLDVVNPGLLPPVDHAQHDRWLVVRAASHDTDLTSAETTAARVLLDDCSECAALAADITTITHATAESIAPSRPRDFRLTPQQAESARGGFLDRLGRWLSSPRATLVRPLAGASLAIGLVLVVVAPTIQGPIQPPSAQVRPPAAEVDATGGTAATAGAPDAAAGAATPDPAMATIDPRAMDTTMMVQPSEGTAGGPESYAQQVPEGSFDFTADASSQPPSTDRQAKATTDPEIAGVDPVPGATAEANAGGQEGAAPAAPRTPDDTTKALVLLGIVLAGTGLLVLLLTWLARRMSRDPFLPDR